MEIGKNDATNSTDEAVEEVITGLCCCTVSQQFCGAGETLTRQRVFRGEQGKVDTVIRLQGTVCTV